MICGNKGKGIFLGIVVIVFALWETVASKWILVAAGILLLLHGFTSKRVAIMQEKPRARPKRKK